MVVSVGSVAEGFEDDAGVHEPAIDALAARGILDGTECGADRFCPNTPITRWVVAV